jgi:hypothetical protein
MGLNLKERKSVTKKLRQLLQAVAEPMLAEGGLTPEGYAATTRVLIEP